MFSHWPLARLLVAALLAAILAGCGSMGPAPVGSRGGYGPAPEGYYRILPGDTLGGIAIRQRVDSAKLAAWNDLEPPYRIYAGKLLRMEPPDGTRTVKRSKQTKSAVAASGASQQGKSAQTKSPQTKSPQTKSPQTASPAKSRAAKGGTKAAASGLSWRWPLKGRVIQTFNRGDRTRQGIRIAGSAGVKVVAAEAGTVVYSGSGLKGYGNLIIVKHKNDYLSAYGFNRRLLIAEGARVKRGQSVAEVGQASGGEYLLHFEIRRDGTAVNPLDYLPRSR